MASMNLSRRNYSNRVVNGLMAIVLALALSPATTVSASTYVAYIPLDSPIYSELDTLDGLGLLDSYIREIKPISRVEAARLAVEARRNLARQNSPNLLAVETLGVLRAQLAQEIYWRDANEQDRLPTMIRPVERLELGYVYSGGQRRSFSVIPGSRPTIEEATPLLPANSDLPTASGSNGAALWSGWTGFGGFLTGYAEGAYAGPFGQGDNSPDRDRIVAGAVVVDLGNIAISFGNEQMEWGVGHFGQLSQSINASAFPALRIQNVYPRNLPGSFRYLGPFRWQAFFGQLDNQRPFAHPWIDGEIVAFKPLPDLDLGLTHAIEFGGHGNDHYDFAGFLGRATGFSTGNPAVGNTNTRVSLFGRLRFPSLRGIQLYGEILGEDFFQPFGKSLAIKMPFKSPSYLLGLYDPRLTADGLTDGRIEWAFLDRNYSTHNDSLYWAYDGRLMGYALGPRAQRLDIAIGRWIDLHYKFGVDAFYEERLPISAADGAGTEHGEGLALDLFRMPLKVARMDNAMVDFRMRTSLEYVSNLNFTGGHSMRVMLQLTIGLTPHAGVITWR